MFFRHAGKMPFLIVVFIISSSGLIILGAHFFSKYEEIPSAPVDLLFFILRVIFNKSSSVISGRYNESVILFVTF
jgi:hypothetical protein